MSNADRALAVFTALLVGVLLYVLFVAMQLEYRRQDMITKCLERHSVAECKLL